MSTPEHREVAELMLGKARADLSAARLLASDAAQDDGVVGFHAQQACEKALKAVLAVSEVDIPLTHNLRFLLELVDGTAVETPDAVQGVVWLNPWAVTMRYDETESPLHRDAAIAAAVAAVEWATSVVADR